jgi:GNAT superfamily N-acetyltransferase
MDAQQSRSWKSARESLYWRGFVSSAVLAAREFVRPVMYWHAWHIFRTDVRVSTRDPYARKHVSMKIYSGAQDIEAVSTLLSGLGEISAEEIRTRLLKGDAVAVAFAAEQGNAAANAPANAPVGYMWLAFASGQELAFGVVWILHPGEALRYGSYVAPEWRGFGVHSSLNHAANEYALSRGMTHTFASIGILNRQSLNLAKHHSNPPIMTVVAVNFRLVNWTVARGIGAPFASRFSRHPRGAGNEQAFDGVTR